MLSPSSPVFVELLLWLLYGLLTVAVVLTLWSALRSIRLQGRGSVVSNGIPVGRIAWGVAAMVLVLLIVTYFLGSTAPLAVNGNIFSDAFWLRASDMFIYTSLLLIAIAVLGVLFGVSGLSRRINS